MKNSFFIKNIILAVLTLAFIGCGNEEEIIEINPAFSEHISAFTSGVISSESTIRVRLMKNSLHFKDDGEPIEKELFDFDPSIDGEAYWINERTIEFHPEENMPSGIVFKSEFELDELIDGLPDDLETFVFQFQTIKQSFSVDFDTYKTYEKTQLKLNKLPGTVHTADVIDNESIEKVLFAKQGGKELEITWEHESDRKTHHFQIEKIVRKETPEEVIVSWDGDVIDIENSGEELIEIPALGDFKVLEIEVVQQPEQYVSLAFSDPLKETQNLNGLIQLEGNTSLRFIIEDNQIRVYPSVRQSGTKKLKVAAGIKNILNYKMKESSEIEIVFEDIKPAVRLIGQGVILPSSDGLTLPFEAVNLSAVNVRVIQIFENNVAQFLQVNQLDGDRQLKRVGRLVHKETIQLTSEKPVDFGKWNTFSLDLSKFIAAEPGAIYKIELSFKKSYSLFPCAGDDEDTEMTSLEENWDDDDEAEQSNWDYYDNYYYNDYYYYDDYGSDYDYSERNNPCSSSYYRKNRSVSRNVLASDLGIIAKAGNNNNMTFAVSDLKTTEPLSGVTIELYNYQQQLLGTVQTDGDGLAKIKLNKTPFLLVAKKGTQRGYLRLDDGSSLSLSKFDVQGNVIQEGIKGFIYGERGVWRPGDSLFVMFILEDKDNLLPEKHPVSFELINPQGQVVNKAIKTRGLNGFYNFSTSTESDAPTGNWSAKIKVGGATFRKTIKIETIKPNRLKINLDFGVDKLTVSQSNLQGKLNVKWLHGATAKNLKANIKTTLFQTSTTFKRYPDYVFDDPARRFNSEEITVFDGHVDSDGNAAIGVNLDVRDDAPGMLKASFVARVFEESGDFSIDRFSIPYSPYSSYVGIKLPKGDKARGMLLTDTSQTVHVVTVDEEGNKISRSGLEVEVFKVEWRWWWSNNYEDLSSYIGSSYYNPIVKKTVNTTNGSGKFTFRVDYPEWGRYLVRVYDPVSGHATGKTVYLDWPGWAGRAERENPGGASMLSFSSDKKKYNVGEFSTISFPSAKNGRALVSIESGSKVIDAYWVDTEDKETSFNFKVTEQMTPNVYVNITLVQPHLYTANDLPIRLYGVIPIMVEDPNSRVEPVINMPKVLAPEEKVTINIKEKEGKAMTYTIAVVDEGLLDLTRFKTPDAWNSFYAREALGVKTWDMYDMVMGAYGGKLAQIFAIGGDGELSGKKGNKANRFKPMVKFLGPFQLKKGDNKTHSFIMPKYIGSVRTMVIAGQDEAYGFAEKTTPVRKPLMVLATLPRVVGPGEQVKLPVTVFAMEKKIKNVTVEVKANKFFSISGGAKKSITFSEVGDQIVNFDLSVAKRLGIGTVQVIVSSGSEKATYDIEIDVRNPNPPVVDYYDAVIESGQSWSKEYTPIGMSGTNKGTLEISRIPPIDFGRRLKYLLQYPHGCVEQTTSAAFPQLFLGTVMDVDNKMKAKISTNIKAAIKRLRTFQLANGGLGYWPNSNEAGEWGTNYAGHFMLEAEKKGYTLPIGFRSNWIKYQKKTARNWSAKPKTSKYYYRTQDLVQAYRLYTLALAKKPALGAMNRLREHNGLSTQARWRLAAAYVLAGQPETAKKLTTNLSSTVSNYTELSYSYGSGDRDRAMILETMSLMKDRSKAISLMKQVSKALSGGKWMSTQTTAYCLIAMSKFAGDDASSKELKFSYKIGKGNVNAATKMAVSQVDMKLKGKSTGNVKIRNTGKGVIYARIVMEGIPETGDQSSSSSNLNMSIKYLNMNGTVLDITQLEQGTDFMAEVTITNPGILGNYKEMALTQIFPSGWEIHNTRMDGFTNVNTASIPTYQDIRDDRVYSYFDLRKSKSKTFRILLNAAYLGKFYLPTVYCEAMYDNNINARKPGKWVEVIKPGN